MVSIWCIIKEFLKKVGIAIGFVALFLGFACVLGFTLETIAKALGPAMCAAITVFFFAALFIVVILSLLWLGWAEAKNKCEIEAMKAGRQKNAGR